MNILIACEESQAITIEMRKLGNNCFSADILECSGGHPEWHIKGDCLPLLNGNCEFMTQDGVKHKIEGKWDMIIAHPPCTYLTVSGNRWFNKVRYGNKAVAREREREEAVRFFMKFVEADCDKIAIENPIGVMSKRFKKPTQIIQPYMFGDKARKTTCLWLKNLPCLFPTKMVKPELVSYECSDGKIATFDKSYCIGLGDNRGKARSKTFPGIAKAIAEQWG